MPNPPSISAIVVTIDRASATRECIESLLQQRGEALLEVVVVLNGASAEVEATVETLAERDARIVQVRTERVSGSVARNRGVEVSRGEFLHFLDDDVIVDRDAVERVAHCFEANPEVGIVGGPNLTPADDPPFAHLSGAILATAWGTGATRARYGTRAEGRADERHLILCNLAMRREIFTERGLSFPALFGGEENALMGEASNQGVVSWYSPEVVVYHRRRTSLGAYCEQIHRYGWGRANAIARAPGTLRLIYFVPVAFLAYLIALPFVASAFPLTLVPLAAYALGTVGASLGLALGHRRPLWFPAALLIYPLTHLVYAAGLIRQGLRFAFVRELRAAVTEDAK